MTDDRGHVLGRAGWRRARASPIVFALAVACAALFVALLWRCGAWRVEVLWSVPCERALEELGAMKLARVWVEGEAWRVVTTAFLHGSVLHLVVNVYSLLAVGEWVEAALGSVRTLAVFLVCSVAGALASLGWAEASIVVGASGGVLGLAGVLLVLRTFGDERLRGQLAAVSPGVLASWLAGLVALGWFVPFIAQAGHLGGLGAGILLGFAMARRGVVLSLVGLVSSVVATVLLVSWAKDPVGRVGYHAALGHHFLEQNLFEQAGLRFDRALALSPEDADLQNAVAYALAEAGHDLTRARSLVLRALASEPENADFLDTLGWIECRLGEADSGRQTLERAREAARQPIAEIELHLEQCVAAALRP